MAIKWGLADWQAYQPRDDANAPIVLAFGDSWLYYPMPGVGNLSNRFLDFGVAQAIDIAAIGRNGLEIGQPGAALLYQFTTFLDWEQRAISLIVVSGGGNELTGADDLDPLLQKGSPLDAASWFRQDLLDRQFDQIHAGYARIIALRDARAPGTPILTHCYDYAHASGKGVLWLAPWIKPSLDKIGMPEALRDAAIRLLVDRLAVVQASFVQVPHYHFVDTRGTLGAGDWSNELHPTLEGFNKLARRFYPWFAHYCPGQVRPPRWF